jgi:uncharacterized membrane protein SpoIIM required for sporulation
MRQQQFEQRYQSQWDDFNETLCYIEKRKQPGRGKVLNESDFPHLYRQMCHHLSIAKARHYSPYLITQLHNMVLRGHALLYRKTRFPGWKIIHFFLIGFPATLRANHNLFWLSLACFVIPGLGMGLMCYFDSEFIYSLMPKSHVANMESMYDPAERTGSSRGAWADVYMFGFYIWNNVSIGFRVFGMGLLMGVGTILSLLYNGFSIGGVAGHLTQLGYTETFWPFVIGHGSFELTAIVICGAAGFKMAQPLIRPGPYRRLDALRIISRDALTLVIGGGFMLFVAAIIEAFWSPNTLVSPSGKYLVGAILWLLVLFYFTFQGRGYAREA